MNTRLLFACAFIFCTLSLLPGVASASELPEADFFVSPSFDSSNRSVVNTHLLHEGSGASFYIDEAWYSLLEDEQKEAVREEVVLLDEEFTGHIFPVLTETFGSSRADQLTVVFHEMRRGAGGYFNPNDMKSLKEYGRSNEREMVYLNTQFFGKDMHKSFLAHEFVHVITYYQKRAHGVNEASWLNELRAEMAPTLLGYDEEWSESNLRKRQLAFLSHPVVSLPEWGGTSPEYGSVNLLGQYLIDHYGVGILQESLASPLAGSASLAYALEKSGYEKSFTDVFREWGQTLLVNDCSAGEFLCYKNEQLLSFRIFPQFYPDIFAEHADSLLAKLVTGKEIRAVVQ